ncbi:MAG TPA: spore coat associated protein CotJA [Bacilli bacterium]|nr:spore coat associated protein CotJA [Bacilli bacterium]
MFTQKKVYAPYVSPFDPCRPMTVKTYETPPQLYLPVQPPNLPQWDPYKALQMGTLWPAYYSPYEGRGK